MEQTYAQLVAAAAGGESAAAEELYRRTAKSVYYTILKLVRNDEDAQDLTQDTYVKAFQLLGTMADGQAFQKWVNTIAVNLAKDWLKKRRPLLFRTTEEEQAVLEAVPETGEDFLPAEWAERADRRERLVSLVDALPEEQRSAVYLYYFDELSVQEVAAVMEVNENTVKSRLNYARKKLRDQAEGKGVALAAVPLLRLALQGDCAASMLPAGLEQAVLGSALGTAGATAVSAGTTATGAATGAAAGSAGTAGAAAGTAAAVAGAAALGAKAAGMGLGIKIAAGVVAAALVVGGGIGVAKLAGNGGGGFQGSIHADVDVMQELNTGESGTATPTTPAPIPTPAPKPTPQPTPTPTPEPEGPSEAERLALYQGYISANYPGGNTLLADVTGDGQKEVLVTTRNVEDMFGDVVVLGLADGAVKELWSAGATGYHAGENNVYLCNVEGQQYLMEYAFYMSMGYINYRVDVYQLNENGEQVFLDQAGASGEAEFEDSNPEAQVVQDKVDAYLQDAIPLVYTEWSGDSPGGVYIYEGDALTTAAAAQPIVNSGLDHIGGGKLDGVKPITGEIVQERFHQEDDIPDVFKVSISIPKLREDLPNAAKVNDQISADFKNALSATGPEHYEVLNFGFSYPEYHCHYIVSQFDGLYEITVQVEEWSSYGSGAVSYSFSYYYDTQLGDTITQEAFLARVGIAKQDVVEAYKAFMADDYDYTFDEIRNSFYIDENREIVITGYSL